MNEMHWAILGMVGGLTLLIVGGELLVRGASQLAATMRISPLVIGLTVVAFGTSSPELAVSVQSALGGNADIALGNVVGSNIFNILFILGLSALIVPLRVSAQLIRLDVPVMVAASALVLIFALDGRIGRIDGVLLFGGLVTYTYWCITRGRRESDEVQAEFKREISQPKAGLAATVVQLGLIGSGLILLGVGTKGLVGGAVTVAIHLQVSQLIIGLTIVSVGTSLPEVVTSIMAAWRGERDIAVGNVVGSNLFNVLGVLGLSSIISPSGIGVSSTALYFDIPVMIAAAVACLPIFFTGNVIARWEGGLFFFYYLVYTTHLLLEAIRYESHRTVLEGMVVFVIPLTILTLLITVYRTARRQAPSAPDSS
jgi:cation:H+ antiporter